MSLIQLSWGSVGLLLVLAYFVWEFLWYQFHKRGMQGPVLPLPVFGFLFEMIYNPVKFWEDQHKYNPNGISAHRYGRLQMMGSYDCGVVARATSLCHARAQARVSRVRDFQLLFLPFRGRVRSVSPAACSTR